MKKKHRIWIYSLTLLSFAFILANSCKKDDNNNNNNNSNGAVPVLTTSSVTNITSNTATCGGNITSDEGSNVTARGVCWSTGPTPTINDNKTSDGTGTGSFTSSLTGLTASTTYYVRAYATNSTGTGYGSAVSFTTITDNIVDFDGNIYHPVTIGTQVWMIENLKTLHYRDGTPIPVVTDGTTWTGLTTGACCYQQDDVNNIAIYGVLYNWFAVTDTRQLCPAGWHVPTMMEWNTLQEYLGGDTIAGGKMKTTGTLQAGTGLWEYPNVGATNSSHFTGLPGACRAGVNYTIVGSNGLWWTSTSQSTTKSFYQKLNYDAANLSLSSIFNACGLSVRCIKD
jgi:uncharacterized protein (TIGR02145 family)